MKIRQIGSAVGNGDGHQNLTTFLINETVAIDAGCLGYISPVEVQRAVKQVFLSHSHIDHVGSLPSFLSNVYEPRGDGPTIHAGGFVLDSLRRDLFNDRIWPDLERLSAGVVSFYRTDELVSERPVVVEGLTITPIEVNHVVPTHGFLVQDATGTAVLFVSDSGPTERIWEIANATPGLKMVFMECSFPNALGELAMKTKHLTPALFERELAKLKIPAQIVAVHLKTGFHQTVVEELNALKIRNLEIGGGDRVWEVS
ncbi:MAG: 3',5'-cyclic-nucleotide phosphodiesterase [Planctomycetales bacterium]